MDTKTVSFFGKKINVATKELVDPKFIEIRAITKQPKL